MKSMWFWRAIKRADRQDRSERRGEAYCFLYVEPLSDARTKLAAFFIARRGVA
jgi:hypothetical protein